MKIPVMHSAAWDDRYARRKNSRPSVCQLFPYSVNFKNKRIGIIGGGSSAIQIIPNLQKLPGTKLSCFIRSKAWIAKPIGESVMKSLGIEDEFCKS